MREIWDLQQHMLRRGGNRVQRLMEHPRFRAAYDFVLLREQSGENLDGLGAWWTAYQSADEQSQEKMAEETSATSGNYKRSRRRRNSKRQTTLSE